MADRHRVPQNDDLFDQYIRNTSNVLESGTPYGAVRLDLSANMAADWLSFRDRWVVLYPKYTNKATRTMVITEEKNGIKKEFVAFTKKAHKRIEGSGQLTTADRLVFRIKERKKSYARRGVITDIPFGTFKETGGGMVQVRGRREQEEGRGRMHELADNLELRYLVMSEEDFISGGGSLPGLEQCTTSLLSKKTMWRMEMGYHNQGKRLFGFMRWVNLSNPNNNGGWSDVISGYI